jgi:hypothetical protein
VRLVNFIGRVLGYAIAGVFIVILFCAVLAVPAAVVFAGYKAFPKKKIEPQPGEGWLDTIFANQYVIFSARLVLIGLALVLLFGAVYMAVSIFYRMFRREFLHKVGWFEADVAKAADRELEQVGSAYQEMLNDAWTQNEELEARFGGALEALEQASAETDALRSQLADAQAQIATFRAKPGAEGAP